MARLAETHDSREEAAISRHRRDYVHDNITLDEFEERVEKILSGEVNLEPEQDIPILSGQRVYL